MTTEEGTYNIGFTAGAAMLNEMRAVAEAFLDCGGDWEKTKDKTFKENLMEKDKMSSNVRYFALFTFWPPAPPLLAKVRLVCWITDWCNRTLFTVKLLL